MNSAGGEITASEDFRLLFRRRARFRPVAHVPETAAVRAALPLAPADVATTPGLGVSTTGMGPTSAEPRSAHRALGSPWWRPLRRPFKVPTTWEGHTGLFCCGACATSLLMSSLHPPASLVACRTRHWLASPHPLTCGETSAWASPCADGSLLAAAQTMSLPPSHLTSTLFPTRDALK